MERNNKKGLLVVFVGPSQRGKDFLARQLENSIIIDEYPIFYPTAYKVREQRQNDPAHIKCVQKVEDIPIANQDKIEYQLYGDQNVVYNKSEIEEAINSGCLSYIATGSPSFAKQLKSLFGDNCISVFIRGQQTNRETMIKEEFIRAGKDFSKLETIEKNTDKRIAFYERLKPEFQDFMKDENLGADYIYTNWFTLFGGPWNSTIENCQKDELYGVINYILDVLKFNEASQGKSWKDHKLFEIDKDLRKKDALSLQQDYIEYITEKRENE